MRTLSNGANVLFHHLRWPECVEHGLRAIALTSRVNDPPTELSARLYTMRALINMGDLPGARHHGETLLQAAERLRHRSWLGNSLQLNGNLAQHVGDWPKARALTDRALAVEPQEPRHLCIRAVLEYQSGDTIQDDVHIGRLLDATHRAQMGAGFA
jgi:uncharacterized protein HemY